MLLRDVWCGEEVGMSDVPSYDKWAQSLFEKIQFKIVKQLLLYA